MQNHLLAVLTVTEYIVGYIHNILADQECHSATGPFCGRRRMKNNGKIRLSSKAYDEIRQLIVTLHLKPGEQIEEGALEKQLSIGRTPIREALQRLAVEGLLELVPGRGFFIRPISIDDVKSLFEAMTALEQIIVRLAAYRIQENQLIELHETCMKHREANTAQDYIKVVRYNKEFHRCFYAATGNVFLLSSMEALQHQSERLAYLTYTREALPAGCIDYNALAIEDHEQLVQCLCKGDAESAVEIITRHCRRFFLRICLYMEPLISPTNSELLEQLFVYTNTKTINE